VFLANDAHDFIDRLPNHQSSVLARKAHRDPSKQVSARTLLLTDCILDRSQLLKPYRQLLLAKLTHAACLFLPLAAERVDRRAYHSNLAA
jgi:hypothetical protein